MKKTTNKKTTATVIGAFALCVCAVTATLCFTGCGSNNNSSKTETTAAPTTVAARQPTNRSRRLISKKQLLKHARQLQTFTAKATGALRALKQRPPMPARKCTISA